MNFQILKLNQTKLVPEWVDQHHIKECGWFYLYDAERGVYCCELTPSYELFPINGYWLGGSYDFSDEEAEQIETEWMESEQELVTYLHISDCKRLTSQSLTDYFDLPEREEDENDEAYYLRIVEEAQEYFAGNPIFF